MKLKNILKKSSGKNPKLVGNSMDKDKDIEDLPEDEEVQRLMQEHGIDEDTAQKAQELIDEGLDEDDALEISQDL